MNLSKLNRAIFEMDEFLLSRSFVQYLYPVYPHPSPGSLRVVKRLTLYWHSYPVEVTTAVKLLTYSGAQVFCQGEKTVVDFWLPLVTASLPPGYPIKLPVSPSFLSNLLQQDYKQCTWWRKTTRGCKQSPNPSRVWLGAKCGDKGIKHLSNPTPEWRDAHAPQGRIPHFLG